MFIKNLKLENIGVFKVKKEFEFTKGSNLILGENGKGKSTIIEILSLLIVNVYEGNLESLINNSYDSAYAELEFEHNNKNYKNSISICKKKNTTSERKLYEDDKLVASGEDVEKYLNKILPKELINHSLFSKQRGTKFTNISDSERRGLLAQLCELDYSTKIKDVIEPQIEFLKGEINTKEKQEYSLENKTYNFGTEKEIENEWSDEDENNLKDFEDKQKLYEKNFELKKRISDLNYKVHDLNDEYERKCIEYNVEKLNSEMNEKLNQLKKDHEVNLAEIEENTKQNKFKLEKTIEELNDEMETLENQLSNIKIVKLVKFNEDELIERRKDYTQLTTNKEVLFEKYEELKNKLEIAKNGRCPYKED